MSRAVKTVAQLAVRADLAPGRWMVAVIIAAHADRDGVAWPGLKTIAELTGLHRRTVIKALIDLEDAGLLAVTRRPGKPNRYRLAIVIPLALVSNPQVVPLEGTPSEHTRGAPPVPLGGTPTRAPIGAPEDQLKQIEARGHPYPCCCDDCMAAIEARRA